MHLQFLSMDLSHVVRWLWVLLVYAFSSCVCFCSDGPWSEWLLILNQKRKKRCSLFLFEADKKRSVIVNVFSVLIITNFLWRFLRLFMWWDLVLDLFYSFILVSTDFEYFFGFITGLEVKVKNPSGIFPGYFYISGPSILFYFLIVTVLDLIVTSYQTKRWWWWFRKRASEDFFFLFFFLCLKIWLCYYIHVKSLCKLLQTFILSFSMM